jgi:hypothetical protein
MICPIWSELQARFVRAAKAIEESTELAPDGKERNQVLNAAARIAQQELRQHESEHGCAPTSEDLVSHGRERWQEAVWRVEARKEREGS